MTSFTPSPGGNLPFNMMLEKANKTTRKSKKKAFSSNVDFVRTPSVYTMRSFLRKMTQTALWMLAVQMSSMPNMRASKASLQEGAAGNSFTLVS